MDIIIRDITKDDVRETVLLHNLIWRSAYSHIFPEEVFVDRENKTEKRINEYIIPGPNNKEQIKQIAIVDNKIVGLMGGAMTSQYEYFAKRGYADLQGLYIHPDYQKCGIGTRFRQNFEKWAKSNGATKYVIGVLKDNHKARAAYEKWGGKLSRHSQPYIRNNMQYEEVFYTFKIQ